MVLQIKKPRSLKCVRNGGGNGLLIRKRTGKEDTKVNNLEIVRHVIDFLREEVTGMITSSLSIAFDACWLPCKGWLSSIIGRMY